MGSMNAAAAITYAQPDDYGRYGVDISIPDIDSMGWNPARHDGPWTLEAADAHLATLGYRRTSEWDERDYPEVGQGWEAWVVREVE